MWHFYVTMRVLEHMTTQQALLLRFLSSYYLSILPKKKAFSLQKAWHSHCIQMNTYYFAGIFQFDIAKVFTFILLAAVNLSMYLLTMFRTNAAIGNNRWIGCGKRQLSRKKKCSLDFSIVRVNADLIYLYWIPYGLYIEI